MGKSYGQVGGPAATFNSLFRDRQFGQVSAFQQISVTNFWCTILVLKSRTFALLVKIRLKHLVDG